MRRLNVTRAFIQLFLAAVMADAAPRAQQTRQDNVSTSSIEELRSARKEAAHRKRRIIFNNDGNEPVVFLREASAQALLDCRTTPLLGSQVDSIFYCTWSAGFGNFTHNTKVGEVFDTTTNPVHATNTNGGYTNNQTAAFIRQGTDPLKIMTEFCRKNRIEIFWSMRMNDTHDASSSWYGPVMMSRLKKAHPEWLVSSKASRSRHGAWSAMDYSHAEVRDLAVRYIEEVCANYDVDGIEMDFMRHPVVLKDPAWGRDATTDGLAMMTDLQRRVRDVTEREGLRRGRPILVSVRVPDSVDFCRAMGLDIERWLADGLIDLMVVSDYFRLNPWEVSVELGHRYGVPVYPSLSESRMPDKEAREIRGSEPGFMGRAANAWESGVDGIYLFNFFNPHSARWRQVGDPKVLAGLEKIYTTGARGVANINTWIRDGEKRFLRRKVVSPERPMVITRERPGEVQLRVADAFDVPSPPRSELRLRWESVPGPMAASFSVNGNGLEDAETSGSWTVTPVEPRALRRGDNTIGITLKPDGPTSATLMDVVLSVKPG